VVDPLPRHHQASALGKNTPAGRARRRGFRRSLSAEGRWEMSGHGSLSPTLKARRVFQLTPAGADA